MAFSPLQNSGSTLGQFILTALLSIVLAFASSYLTIVAKSIPRADAEQLVKDAEARETTAINKLSDKQDQIMDKLEDIKIKQQELMDRMVKR